MKYYIFFFSLLMFNGLQSFDLHPAHKVDCSLRYNRDDDIIEVELRMATKDIEDFWRYYTSEKLNLDRLDDAEAKSLLAPYIKKHLNLDSKKGDAYQWNWVGFEIEQPYVWIYCFAPADKETINLDSKPEVTLFCEWGEVFNFMVYTYNQDELVQSFITSCNVQHSHHH